MAVRGTALQSQLGELALAMIPPLSVSNHKGQMGRVAVVGGCKEYTGAPYYAGMSALKLGADLSFVFCMENAATPIKTYSPELIVIPLLDSEGGMDTMKSHWLPRLHAVVVGPGLGREEHVHNISYAIVREAVERSLPIVVDADGISLLLNRPDMLDGCAAAVVTPNIAEFTRLCKGRLEKEPGHFPDLSQAVVALAKSFKNVTVVVKGAVDVISDGDKTLTCDVPGTLRRCGGQGDVLSGCMATWLHWAQLTSASIATTGNAIPFPDPSSMVPMASSASGQFLMASSASGQFLMGRTLFKHYGPVVSAAYAACSFTRTCAHLAFQCHGRTMTTPNLLENFSKAMTACTRGHA